MSGRPSIASSYTQRSDMASDSDDFSSYPLASHSADSHSLFNSFGNFPSGDAFDNPFIRTVDQKKNPQVETTVYDMQKSSGFVKGEVLQHSFEIEGLKSYIQNKYQTDAKCIIFKDDTVSVCCIVKEEQLSEIQIMISSPLAFEVEFSDVSGEVTRCVSVSRDSDVRELLERYNDKTECSMDAIYFPRDSLVAKEGQFLEYEINQFDKGRLFQDCHMELSVVHSLDDKREMVLHVICSKGSNVGEVKEILKKDFSPEFGHIVDQGLDLCLSRGLTVFRDEDCIFLDECPISDTNDHVCFNVNVHISARDSVPFYFMFQKKTRMVIISKTATVQDFRHAASMVIHKPAKRLEILHKGKKVDDNIPVSHLIQHSKRSMITVERVSEKIYTFSVVNMESADGEHTISIKAYKHDTLADVKQKAATSLKIRPFNLQLLLNASQLNESSTLHANKIRSGDVVQIVVFPNRVRICLKQSKGGKCFLIVDETKKSTVSDLKIFCGQMWETDPARMIIIFNGSILNEETMTLCDTGVVCGSVLIVGVSTETQTSNLQNVISLFTAGSDAGIQQKRAIKMYGRVLQVDDHIEFDRPQIAFFPSLNERLLKGLHLEQNHIKQSACCSVQGIANDDIENAKNHNQDINRNCCDGLRHHNVLHQSGVCDSSTPTGTETARDIPYVAPASTSTAVCNVTQSTSTTHSVALMSKPCTLSRTGIPQGLFYRGDDVSSDSKLVHCVDTQHVIRSPDGAVVGVHSSQYIGVDNSGAYRSISDSALSTSPCSIPIPLTQSVSLPEPRNAVPERVLNLLADELCNDWWTLGLELGVSYKNIEKIRHDQQNDLKAQALCMLHKWKIQKGGEATIPNLCEALRRCKLVSFAEGIENPDFDCNTEPD